MITKPAKRILTIRFWRTCALDRQSIDEIETIISRDKKDATYKLVLLRALCDMDSEIVEIRKNLCLFHFVLN